MKETARFAVSKRDKVRTGIWARGGGGVHADFVLIYFCTDQSENVLKAYS